MPFSAILAGASLVSSFFGSKSANKQAKADNALQSRLADQNFQMQRDQLAFGREQFEDAKVDREYMRQMEQLNRILASEERAFDIGQLDEYSGRLLDERQYMLDRQVQADRAAANQRAFQLTQLLSNQQITAAEREFAKAELAKAQSTAKGERDEELMRFYQDREKAQIEREFMLGEYGSAKAAAQGERDTDVAMRQQIMNQITNLTSSLEETQRNLGYVPQIEQITQDDINREVTARESEYLGDVDRAATLVASQNEAGLIRGGMDASSPAIARRGDIAGRIANEYTSARRRAYEDAMGYIAGKSQTMNQNVEAIMGRRNALLGETASVAGAGIDPMTRLPQLTSTVGVYDMASRLGSGILDRNIGSANNFNAPVSINSGVYDNTNLSYGMADTLNLPSSATLGGMQIRSGMLDPYSVGNFEAGTSMYNSAGGLNSNMFANVSSNASKSLANSQAASSTFGNTLYKVGMDYAPAIDNWYNSNFGNQSAKSYVDTFYKY